MGRATVYFSGGFSPQILLAFHKPVRVMVNELYMDSVKSMIIVQRKEYELCVSTLFHSSLSARFSGTVQAIEICHALCIILQLRVNDVRYSGAGTMTQRYIDTLTWSYSTRSSPPFLTLSD